MNGFRYTTPPVVKNLIIANCVMLLATTLLPFRNELIGRLALFNVESPLFHSYQVVTYMFLHGGVSHLFFNMFALWMFGRALEYELGSQRFLTYYRHRCRAAAVGRGLCRVFACRGGRGADCRNGLSEGADGGRFGRHIRIADGIRRAAPERHNNAHIPASGVEGQVVCRNIRTC